MNRAHIIYSGRVQGVGFRYTVQRHAITLNLTGWVKNLTNGSVEIMAEGPKSKIEQLCQMVEDYFDGYIQNKDIQFLPIENEFKGFNITY